MIVDKLSDLKVNNSLSNNIHIPAQNSIFTSFVVSLLIQFNLRI